jgi:hypothetical protein
MTAEASELKQASQPHAGTERPLTAFGALLGVIIHPRATFRRMREAKRGHWWVALLLTLVTIVLLTTVTGTLRARQFAEFQAQREAAQAESEEESITPNNSAQGNAPGDFQGGGPGGGPPGGAGGPGGSPPGGVRVGGGGIGSNSAGFLLRQVGGGSTDTAFAGPTTSALGTAISGGTSTVTTLLGYLLRGLLVLVLGLVLGGRASFKQVFRMGVWTTLPFVIRNVIQLIATAVTGRIPVSGLAGLAFGAGNVSPVLAAILGNIDIYLIWSLILLGVGVAATTQLSRIKSAIVALGYWLVTIAASLGWVALIPTLFGFGN